MAIIGTTDISYYVDTGNRLVMSMAILRVSNCA